MKPDNRLMNTMPHHSQQRGFTLIELMVVVVILGILAAIAIPNYMDSQRKSRRSEARTLLMQIVAKQEHFFQDNRTYSGDFLALGTLAASSVTAANVTGPKGYYTITIALTDPYTYTLTATPVAGGPQASDDCTTLTINQDGTKGFTPPTAVGCW